MTDHTTPPPTPHECDEFCVCPIHGTPLVYSPAGNDHACQAIECRYGHGMNAARTRTAPRALHP